MTRLVVKDAIHEFIVLEGDIVEETPTWLTLNSQGQDIIVWKHNIIERIE